MAEITPEMERAIEIRELAREIIDNHPDIMHIGGRNWSTEDKQLSIQVVKDHNKTGMVIIRPINPNLGDPSSEVFVASQVAVNKYIPGPWEAYMVQLAAEVKNTDAEAKESIDKAETKEVAAPAAPATVAPATAVTPPVPVRTVVAPAAPNTPSVTPPAEAPK